MPTQIIRPAGAGHESLMLLIGCALILLFAGSVVVWRAPPKAIAINTAGQLDARHDLRPAEQGIYADLRVAAEEIMALRATAPQDASPAALAAMGLPPFSADASSTRRGGHRWQWVGKGEQGAYIGIAADNAIAGSLLLRIGGTPEETSVHAGHADEHVKDNQEPDIWLLRDAKATAPGALDDSTLHKAGWRQVVARFDAGATRQMNH